MLQGRYKDSQNPAEVSLPDLHIPIADIIHAQCHCSRDCLGFCHLIWFTECFSEAGYSQICVFQAYHFRLWAGVLDESAMVAA